MGLIYNVKFSQLSVLGLGLLTTPTLISRLQSLPEGGPSSKASSRPAWGTGLCTAGVFCTVRREMGSARSHPASPPAIARLLLAPRGGEGIREPSRARIFYSLLGRPGNTDRQGRNERASP